SWSGERSKRIAEALKDFLGGVIPGAEPWLSSQDVPPGSVWPKELFNGLSQSDFGILCLTKRNLAATWIAFEAGALTKTFGENRVCPFLIDVEIEELKPPFSLFHSVVADKDGTWKLVRSINTALAENHIDEDRLQKNFEAFWRGFGRTLRHIQDQKDLPTPMSMEQMLQTVHETVQETMQQTIWEIMQPTTQQQIIQLQNSKIEALHQLFGAFLREFGH
ncbi:MAG: toll/interleukin-1 receptor domain-containing protein, partial [Thermoproteota archaeon]|nr:toll/interleukin-1 receptor domain-containing protein [Thermoproteota archaeon]